MYQHDFNAIETHEHLMARPKFRPHHVHLCISLIGDRPPEKALITITAMLCQQKQQHGNVNPKCFAHLMHGRNP